MDQMKIAGAAHDTAPRSASVHTVHRLSSPVAKFILQEAYHHFIICSYSTFSACTDNTAPRWRTQVPVASTAQGIEPQAIGLGPVSQPLQRSFIRALSAVCQISFVASELALDSYLPIESIA